MAELGIDLLARQVPGGASNRRGQILIGGLGVGQQTFDALRIAVLRMACWSAGEYDDKSGGGNAVPVA